MAKARVLSQKMSWSINLGKFFGIRVYIHFTFLLLVGFFAFAFFLRGGAEESFRGVIFILLVFLCVTLHEFGHALMAKKYGVKTRDITLLPIGGLARLESMPKEPMREFWIALAGPAVNVVIAAILIPIWIIYGMELNATDPAKVFTNSDLIPLLATVNITLVVFNMLPAFPMDGGRALRALLATQMNYARATNIAAKLGQLMAVVFAVLGFLAPNFILIFIAFFIWIGASGEAQAAQIRGLVGDATVDQAMLRNYQKLRPESTLREVVDLVLHGSQEDFPVVDSEGNLVGVLGQAQYLKGLTQHGRSGLVGDWMVREFPRMRPDTSVEDVLMQGRSSGLNMIPVFADDGSFEGLVTTQNMHELVLIRSSIRKCEEARAKAEERRLRTGKPADSTVS